MAGINGEVFSRDIVPVGTIDRVSSLIWTTRHCSPGNFEMWCPIDDTTKSLYIPGNLIWLKGTEIAMIIQSREEQYDSAGGLQYTLRGRSTAGYLSSRIIWGTYNGYGTPTKCVREIVDQAAVTPTNSDRVIPYVRLDPDQTDFGSTIRTQRTGTQVDTAINGILDPNDLNWKMTFDPIGKTHTFTVTRSFDRSIGNSEGNAPIVFSTDTEDFLESKYFYNEADYRNSAMIGGAGEGPERQWEYIEVGQGFDRHEMYVDARDIADTDEDAQPIPPAEYAEILLQRGETKLDENGLVETFDAKIRTLNAPYQLGRDFFLGDWVTVHDLNLGIYIKVKITEATEDYTSQGYQLSLVFGYQQPTFIDRIRNFSS